MTFDPGIPVRADADPLDSRLAATQGRFELEIGSERASRKSGFSFTAIFRRALVLLPLGMALGPRGLNLLSPSVLYYLEPFVSVTLATLGVCLGARLDFRGLRSKPLVIASSVEAGLTLLIVAGGIAGVQSMGMITQPAPWLALMLGIFAAASLSGATEGIDQATGPATRIGDLDNALAIGVGSLAMAVMREESVLSAGLMIVGLCTVVAMIALAGWLLVGQTSVESEQHAFVAGTLLLLTGSAAYLSDSPLFAGVAAGLIWNATGGVARERILRDVSYLRHPLVVLLFLVAGAHLELWADALVLAFVYLLCRTVGKLAGAWIVARRVASDLPPHLGLTLVSPGVMAIAFGVNALQLDSEPWRSGTLLAVVVIGSLASELLSIVVRAPKEPS